MALLAVLAIFAALVILAVVNPRAGLMVSVFMLPWGGLDVEVGLRVTVYQITLAALLLAVMVRLTQPGLRPPHIAAWPLFAGLVLYAVIWSMLQLGIFPQIRITAEGFRGPTMRAAIQIPLFLFSVSPVILYPMLIQSRDEILALGRVYIAGVVVLALIGWAQLFIWYGTGTNPFPVGAFSNFLGSAIDTRSGAYALDALNIYRMNSFGGEPRDLGVAIIIALIALQSHALVTPRPRTARLLLLWSFLFITLLTTVSTSAIALWVIASPAVIPACWLFGVRIARSGRQLVTTTLLLITPLLLIVAGLQASGIPVIDIIADRTIERVASNGAIEDFDLAILDYLATSPGAAITGVGLGNIHLYATPFLDPLFATYAEGNIFVAKAQYLRFISEIGLIGLALFLGWYLWLTIETARRIPRGSDLAVLIPFASAVLVVAMGAGQGIAPAFAIGGAMTACCALTARQPGRRAQVPQPA